MPILKITPRTIGDFCRFYKITNESNRIKSQEYMKYLTANIPQHHYGWLEDLHSWFNREIALLTGN